MNLTIESLDLWGMQALDFAWPLLWQSSLLIGLLFTLDFTLRRRVRAAVRYALWLVLLLKLVLPPALALPTGLSWWLRPAKAAPAAPPPMTFTVTYGPSVVPPMPEPVLTLPVAAAPARPVLTLAAWALMLSSGMSLGLLGWMLLRWRQVARDVRQAEAAPQSLQDLLEEARCGSGLRRPVRLGLTERPMSPAVCGLFRPTILLPRSLAERLAPSQLRAVLLHELAHLRRGDVWVNCAQALLQVAYWWHPLLWLANARIRQTREEAVDDAVMAALREEAPAYAPTLLEVARLALQRPLTSLGLVGILESRSSLRQRIQRLLEFHPPRKAGLTLASVLLVMGFAALAVPMGEAPKTSAGTEGATNNPSSGPVTNAVSVEQKRAASLLVHDGMLRYQMGKLDEAQGKLHEASKLDPQNQAAYYYLNLVAEARHDLALAGNGRQALVKSLTNSPVSTAATDATGVEGKSAAAKLVHDGILLYEMGKLDEAQGKLHEASKLDPQNQAAYHYLNLVAEARHHDALAGNGRRAIFKKLSTLKLDEVRYDGLPLSEVVIHLNEQSRKSDPEKRGINFIINSNAEAGAAASPAAPGAIAPTNGRPVAATAAAADQRVDISTALIKLSQPLTKVTVEEVLDAIVKAANLPIKYSVEEYGVVFSHKGAEPPQLSTRRFKVDPNTFVQGLQGVSSFTFGATSSGSGGGGGSRNGSGGGGGSRNGGGGGGGGNSNTGGLNFLTRTNATLSVSEMARAYFKTLGVTLDPPKSLFFNDREGRLYVKATEQDLNIIEEAVQVLHSVPPQIHIAAKFVVWAQTDSKAFGLDWYLGNFLMNKGSNGMQGGTAPSYAGAPSAANPSGVFPGNAGAGTTPPPASSDQLVTSGLRNPASSLFTMTGILTDPQCRAVLHALDQRDGSDVLASPTVVTISGRAAQCKAGQMMKIVKGVKAQALTAPGLPKGEENALFEVEQLEVGPVLDVAPTLLEDGYTVRLQVWASVTEFGGYENTTNCVTVYVDGEPKQVQPPQPIVRRVKASSDVHVWDGQTVVLGGLSSERLSPQKDGKSRPPQRSNLLVFITTTLLDSAGNRLHSEDEMPFSQNAIPIQPKR